ncbi:IS91 family transposase [Novipirellula caenicola]
MLRHYAGAYVEKHPSAAVPQVQSTLAKLSLCRTSALGIRQFKCKSCHAESMIYNSCGDRHCSECAGSKRADWLEKTCKLLLPDVDYFQVVFTLPSELSRLALGNRKPIYDLLFRTSWGALRETIEAEQGYKAAAMMVLHTWNQKLEAHGHVHAVVPSGGPSLRKVGHWKRCRFKGQETSRHLVDASELRRNYRKRFIEGLRRLHRDGQLKLTGEFEDLNDEDEFEKLLEKLASVAWGLNIQPPPTSDCDSQTMLKYLARYLTGGPISDRRLVSHDDGMVTFMAREGTTRGGDRKQVRVPLSGVEFVRRWSLHVLPRGYVKTRRYGGWSNRHCEDYMQLCRDLRDCPAEDDSNEDIEPSEVAEKECAECGGSLELIYVEDKPSWSRTMHSPSRPHWYQESG